MDTVGIVDNPGMDNLGKDNLDMDNLFNQLECFLDSLFFNQFSMVLEH